MTQNLHCKACSKKIHNPALAEISEDGLLTGLSCKTKKISIPSMESLLVPIDEMKAINKKINLTFYDLPGKETIVEGSKMYKEFRDIPWDTYSGAVLGTPSHPDAISSIDIKKLRRFDKLLEKKEKAPELGYEKLTDDHLYRAIHCFIKLFRDPNLNKEKYHLYNNILELELVGVAPNVIRDEKHADFSNFVIRSKSSLSPERAILIKVSSAGWINFRCLHLRGSKVDSSEMSNLVMISPNNFRRSDSCSNFQLVSAFVTSIFTTVDPVKTEVFKKVFPFWVDFLTVVKFNTFDFDYPPESED